jgi:hypothetical protein
MWGTRPGIRLHYLVQGNFPARDARLDLPGERWVCSPLHPLDISRIEILDQVEDYILRGPRLYPI